LAFDICYEEIRARARWQSRFPPYNVNFDVTQKVFSMIEAIMYIGIGFLIAGLLVIGVIPLVHARAERLTARRLEALIPLSIVEIQADKDQQRAEFAMSTRRLEMRVEQLMAKTTSQITEMGKKSDAIGRLKLELGEKIAALFVLEAKENQLADELRSLQSRLASKEGASAETERALAKAQADLAQITGNYRQSTVTAETQHVELVALRAQAEALKGQIEMYEMAPQELQDRLCHKTAEAESLSNQLMEERSRAQQLSVYTSELDRQLILHKTEAEILGHRVEELSARLDEQGRFLADYEFISDRRRNGAHAAWPDAENRNRVATESIRAETAEQRP
jgi:chromosome segregation ATPase